MAALRRENESERKSLEAARKRMNEDVRNEREARTLEVAQLKAVIEQVRNKSFSLRFAECVISLIGSCKVASAQ